MVENEITFTHVSECTVCGEIQYGESATDYTIDAGAKREYDMRLPADHDCQFETHRELEEPVTQTVTYEA